MQVNNFLPKEELLISGIQHYVFCRRRWALIHVEQQWEENYLTRHGQILHERVDNPELHTKRKDIIPIRGMQIHSSRFGIRGVCDMVEFIEDPDGIWIAKWQNTYRLLPVEYKRGKPKATNEDRLQVLAQAMCLEEMLLCEIEEGAIYYHATRRREQVLFTEGLRAELEDTLQEMHDLMRRRYTPKVRVTKKCRSCSLRDRCLPELSHRKSASSYIDHALSKEKAP